MKIVVDRDQLDSTAGKIEKYVSTMNAHYLNINSEIMLLGTQWQGADSAKYIEKWQSSTNWANNGSANAQTKKALTAYAAFLRFASNEYKKAQFNVVKKAHKI